MWDHLVSSSYRSAQAHDVVYYQSHQADDHPQVRQGDARRPAKRGVQVIGTQQAVTNEFEQVIHEAFHGEQGKQVKANVERMAKALKADYRAEEVRTMIKFAST